MTEQFDVIIVGARVAGSSLATHLARAGLSVCLLDRARFPSDTLSTHVFQNMPALKRLGVFERLLATGAPLLTEATISISGADLSGIYPDLPMLCVRRSTLDQVLLDNAAKAGAHAHTSTRVTSCIEEGRRIRGVRAQSFEGRTHEFKAAVVIGADGRNSTVAHLMGARRYNVTESERAFVWTYYRGVEDCSPRIYFYRQSEDLFIGCPTDSGLYLVVSVPTQAVISSYRDSDGAGFERAIGTCPPLASLLRQAERIGEPILVAKWQGYFRESAGPGWALVGDAGHFKDPTPGQGISDALRQAEQLASFITAGFRNGTLDHQLQAYWRWRDQDSAKEYWWAQDLGRGGKVSPLRSKIFGEISKDPVARRAFYEMLHHLRPSSNVLMANHLLGTFTRVSRQEDGSQQAILGELKSMIALDSKRKCLNARPEFEQGEAERQSGG